MLHARLTRPFPNHAVPPRAFPEEGSAVRDRERERDIGDREARRDGEVHFLRHTQTKGERERETHAMALRTDHGGRKNGPRPGVGGYQMIFQVAPREKRRGCMAFDLHASRRTAGPVV